MLSNSLIGQINISSEFEIIYEGNQKSSSEYLNSIIDSDDQRSIDLKTVHSDIQKLKNIAGVSNAEYSLDTLGNIIQLVFRIEERRTILPIINFGGIKDNLWFRLGMIDNNWAGKGKVLLAYYQNNDNRHSGQIYYRNPRINNSRWGYSLSFNKWASQEPLYFEEGVVDYLYDNNSFTVSGIFNIDKRRRIELGTSYFIENYKKTNNQILVDPPGPEELTEKKLLFKAIYNEDHLNYHFFYLNGFDWNITYQNVYNASDGSKFNSLLIQTKLFIRPKDKINFATRFRFGISTNNNSPFAPFVVDSHVNIRGVGNRIDRGTGQIILNNELRYTVYHKRKWASQLVAFSDLGTWRNPGGSLDQFLEIEEIQHFVGLGIRVIYQKTFGAILRIDYGIDLYNSNQGGAVIGLGQYF